MQTAECVIWYNGSFRLSMHKINWSAQRLHDWDGKKNPVDNLRDQYSNDTYERNYFFNNLYPIYNIVGQCQIYG